MMTQDKRLWFRARRFGWGWTPITWQGWMALVIADVLAFILLAYRKGEQPSWHWGFQDKHLNNDVSEHNDHD
jgi:hypothetical protein